MEKRANLVEIWTGSRRAVVAAVLASVLVAQRIGAVIFFSPWQMLRAAFSLGPLLLLFSEAVGRTLLYGVIAVQIAAAAAVAAGLWMVFIQGRKGRPGPGIRFLRIACIVQGILTIADILGPLFAPFSLPGILLVGWSLLRVVWFFSGLQALRDWKRNQPMKLHMKLLTLFMAVVDVLLLGLAPIAPMETVGWLSEAGMLLVFAIPGIPKAENADGKQN